MIKHYLISLCIVLGLAGCTNTVFPAEYNKAEQLCKNANQSVLRVQTNELFTPTHNQYLEVLCTENVVIYSTGEKE